MVTYVTERRRLGTQSIYILNKITSVNPFDCLSVCMKTYILKTIKTKSTKLGVNTSKYHAQINLFSEFGHALFRPLKTMKN